LREAHEEGACQVKHDQSDELSGGTSERPRVLVGDEAQGIHRSEHRLEGSTGDAFWSIEGV